MIVFHCISAELASPVEKRVIKSEVGPAYSFSCHKNNIKVKDLKMNFSDACPGRLASTIV